MNVFALALLLSRLDPLPGLPPAHTAWLNAVDCTESAIYMHAARSFIYGEHYQDGRTCGNDAMAILGETGARNLQLRYPKERLTAWAELLDREATLWRAVANLRTGRPIEGEWKLLQERLPLGHWHPPPPERRGEG